MQSLDASEHANMACFAIATVLRAFELDEIGAGGLSMEEALDVLALDLSDNRHSLQLTQRLGAFNPQDIARAVSERMPVVKNGWGAVHLATMAGELRLADTIRILIDSLGSERGDFLCEAAQKSLVQIGEPAELALIAHWDELDSSQKIYGQGALEQIGGELLADSPLSASRSCLATIMRGGVHWLRLRPTSRQSICLRQSSGASNPLSTNVSIGCVS
jgi:hypothetical protein